MSVKFYMDEHVPGPIIRALRARQVDVVTVQEDRRDRSLDRTILLRATELGRVLVSTDEDFFRIVAGEQAAGRFFSGVMSLPVRLSYRAAVEDLELIARCSDAGDWQGLITRLPLR